MKYSTLITAMAILLTGCSTTVPVKRNFPAAPTMLMEKCPAKLQTLGGEKVSIVDLEKTVTVNYTTYYECAVKHDAWIEWYQVQKIIFDQVK